MGTTVPIWVPLVVAALGVLGAAGGAIAAAIITQRHSDRREAAAFDRERERERLQWQRDDRLRTAEEQKAAYVAFQEAVRDTWLQYSLGNVKDALDRLWQVEQSQAHLDLFASPAVICTAFDTYSELRRMVEDRSGTNEFFRAWGEVGRTMRVDLGVGDYTALTPVDEGDSTSSSP